MNIKMVYTGGQSGGDLAGNIWAQKHDIPTEINAEMDYKPLYDPIPTDIKINIVSIKKGPAGGWKERRRYNINHSDLTVILIDKPIRQTRGSWGTYKDCIERKKSVICIDIHSHSCEYLLYDSMYNMTRATTDLTGVRNVIKFVNPSVLNIAGRRKLDMSYAIATLELIFSI